MVSKKERIQEVQQMFQKLRRATDQREVEIQQAVEILGLKPLKIQN